ncbi:MAG TPA: GAF and ANTAR domain-containing protein [Galbitalea sp.]|jgi:hypothetical protein
MDDSALTAALDAVDRSAKDPALFYQPFLEMFPVSGAAVSTVGELLGSETVSASDPVAVRVDELQFDLGEGPCWDAMRLGRPVLEPHLRTRPATVWPAFSQAILDQDVSSLFAFPLLVGSLRIGAVDLYAVDSVDLSSAQTRQAGVMAAAVGRHVLRRALHVIGGDYEDTGNAFSRRLIHQATGMVLAQLRVPTEDAVLILQGHAFATGRTMMEIADDVVERRLTFSHGDSGIEVSG